MVECLRQTAKGRERLGKADQRITEKIVIQGDPSDVSPPIDPSAPLPESNPTAQPTSDEQVPHESVGGSSSSGSKRESTPPSAVSSEDRLNAKRARLPGRYDDLQW